MNDHLAELLVLISNALLLPDLALLLGFSLFCAANLGGILVELVSRARHRPAFAKLVRRVRRGQTACLTVDDIPADFGIPRLAVAEMAHPAAVAQKVLDDLQLRADRLLGRLHLGIRLGPMLGLAGTLIPLGPALKAMAAGDTKKLADGLVIAFATPVVGMLVGGLCFAMHAVRSRWYTQDINDLEFLFTRLDPDSSIGKEHPECASSAA